MSVNEKLLTVEDALNLSREEVRTLYKKHVNPALGNLLSLINFDKKFIKASGMEVWDENGSVYLDFLGGYGSLNVGHNHQAVIDAVNRVSKNPNILQASINPLASALAKNLSVIAPKNLNNVFFGNSGAEAVEGALKTAKIYTGREKIIYCDGSFHGKTMGALSVMGRKKYQTPFLPLIPNCQSIPFGDINSLEEALRLGDVAAFIVEPIQGEGGIIVPPKGYLAEAKKICSKYGTLLIVDEVQTGFGRTGKMFACEWEGVEPDILCLAKSLGGGIMPMGAFMTTKEIWDKSYGAAERATLHTSTFGGNSWAAAAALATIKVIYDEGLVEEAYSKGEYFINKLKNLQEKYSLIKDIRGKGLLIGIEFNQGETILDKLTKGKVSQLSQEYTGALVAGELLNKYRVITAYTINNPNVIRLEPPLIVTYEHLDHVIDSLDKIFASNKSVMKLALSTTKNILGSVFKR